jgi:hypothetical protein
MELHTFLGDPIHPLCVDSVSSFSFLTTFLGAVSINDNQNLVNDSYYIP